MAEPLSLAASIAGLISLADVIFRTTYKFVRAAKDAKDEIQSLVDEISNLSSVLRRLEALTSDLEDEGQSFDPTLRNHYLNHCYKTFNKIESRVKKASESFKKSKFEGIVRQLKWPFSSSETKELLAELSRHKETISVALLADSMRKIQLSLSKSDEIDKKLKALGEVARRIEINTMIDINKRKKRILNHFMKANPQYALQTSIRLRHSMTGLWLTESPTFIRWLETPGSKLWLTGIPGAGKTILAGSVIQEALSLSYASRRTGVAFFFCDYKDSKTWNIVNILGALVSQLARQNDESYSLLDAYYESLYPQDGLPQTADADELRAQISQMCETFDQTIIVVDGIDECDDMTDEVVDNLIQLADNAERVSMAIFSRDHVNIRVRLEEDFEPIQIAAHTEDVELYVNAEVDKRIRTRQLQLASPDMKEEIRSALVGKADGMFRWVVCQLDYLCNCAHDQERREALSKLPPDLPESYRRLLEKVNKFSLGVQNMVQMCLHFMAIAEPKLTIVELRQAVSTTAIGEKIDEGNIVPEYEILKRCSSLIRKSTDGRYFEFAHFSVREFLEDENATSQGTDLGKYRITQHTTHPLLATQCLRFLQMKNFDKFPNNPHEQVAATVQRNETYPFYKHAALLWIKLTKDGLSDAGILDLAKSLFQPSKPAFFMCWAIEVLKKVTYATGTRSALSEIQAWRTVSNPSFQPLHMAAALNIPEICDFLICSGSDVNQKLDAATPLDLAFMSILAVPGLAEMSGTNEKHRSLITNGRKQFLPSAQRRDVTIDCLIHAGARSSAHRIPPNTLSVFSITCLFASIFNDLYPVFRCLCARTTPSVSDVKVLEEWLVATSTSNYVAEVSTRMLLKFLSSTGAYNSDWGAELGLIVWSWAQECDFSLTRDLTLVGSCDLMSDDALVSQLVSAICSDNTELLKYCFKDRRMKNQVRYSGLVNGLLHLAIKYNALDNFKALVSAGFDPYTQNEEGKFPIHLCERHGRLRLCKVLKDLRISLMSQDTEGYNILHYWAKDRPLDYQFINAIFELDTEEAIKGLQSRSCHGDTPLTVVFESAGESPKSEHRDLDLNKLCLQILDFLQRYRRAKDTTTSLGPEKSVYPQKGAFAEFDSMIGTEPTPLHKLKAWVSFDQVNFLIKLYPDAVTSRIDGRLPLERYITNTLENRVFPNSDIIKALFPETLDDTESSETQSLWSFLCCLPDNEGTSTEQYISSKEFETMITSVFELGAMRSHEKQFEESGLKLLLSNPKSSLMPTIRDAIVQTNYWDDLKSSDEISLLFQDVLKSANLDMIRLLNENGANIHRRVDDQTPFEVAFRAGVATGLCTTDEGSAALRELLGHCSVDEAVKKPLEIDRASPLHTLATSEEAKDILWLAEALVQHGFDIDYVGSGSYASTPLVYHLQQSSLQFAERLLELGADPYVSGPSFFNGVLTCIATDKLAFLQKIADHTDQAGTSFRWSDPVTFGVQILGQTVMISNGTTIHLASACNSVACLEYMLDQVSAPDKTSISDEGLSPVHIAAYGGFVDVVKLLLTRGFNAMIESQFGFSPLHMAVFGGHLPVVQCLIEYGAFQTLDTNGMSPGRLAFELELQEIHEVLEGDPQGGYKQISSIQKLTEFVEPTERLALAFERALDEHDYESMIQLIDKGCSADVPLPSRPGLSALLVVLDDGNFAMGEWLLGAGASALQADCNDGSGKSVIELTANLPSLNRLLPESFLKYLRQGGDLRFGCEFPFYEAIDGENMAGLEILLKEAEKHLQYIGSPQAFKDVLNRLFPMDFNCENSCQVWTYHAETTALHIAAWDGNKEAVSLLVDRGANIDAADSNGWTPLMLAQDVGTAQYLLSLGASIAAVCRLGSLPSFINWFGDNLFDEAHPVSFSQLPKELFTVSDPPRFSAKCEVLQLTPETLNNLHQLHHDLTSEDEAGRSMIHYVLGEEDLVDWVLDREQDLSRTTPFPWHLEWCEFSGLALLTSSFERLRQRMPADLFCKILNLEPSRGWSPLCHAAALNRVDIIANCLEMGADINFEGSCFGSAIMNASVCGSLDAVKLLARNGASLTYLGKSGFTSCFLAAGTEAVREWLLCGRFMDQQRLTAESDADCVQAEVPWGGYIQAKVLLYGTRARWLEESTLDYAMRLSKMKKSWQGKVVRLHVEEMDSTSDTDSDTGSEGDAESDQNRSFFTRIRGVGGSDSYSESNSESGSG
ncbi:uncharacterized protein FSUBG_4502 [Fusarium subglutinans]|uniref:Ankyrin n=1 Tax=Gibberella subglutinans TaxID=42677 RepID=A0A8H5Q4N8_GIBSU|nr:uncharacterized protein FSUBG_4502 [Fusarium subglutinans]KAF5608574.1 hypothetical protein FSUBG_4502 [Fusarium subglutinans]